MKQSMTVRDYQTLDEETRRLFDDWLSDAIGEPLVGAHVYEALLGEGFVTCKRWVFKDGRAVVVGHECLTTSTTHPVASLPPVWPA